MKLLPGYPSNTRNNICADKNLDEEQKPETKLHHGNEPIVAYALILMLPDGISTQCILDAKRTSRTPIFYSPMSSPEERM